MYVFSIEPCIVRPIIIVDLNTIELNYYPIIVSLGNCSESCNAADDLSTQIYAVRKTRRTCYSIEHDNKNK